MNKSRQPQSAPRHAPLGQLFAADGTAVPVSITHNRDELLLVVLDRTATLFSHPLTALTLESTSAAGVVRSGGYGMRMDMNMVRFICDDDGSDVVQRREFVRVPAAQRVVLRSPDGTALAVTLTVDLSGGGMLVKLPSSLVIRGSVRFKLFLDEDDDTTVTGVAQVARTRADDQRGLVFSEISDYDRERLIHFIFDRQRKALAITRGDAI